MNKQFRAFRIDKQDGRICSRLETIGLDALTPGDVIIRAAYSGINYKDALAATGKGKILKKFPLVGGVDVSGTVQSSEDDRFKPGDKVLVAGCGLSETLDGGYAEFARAPGDCVIALPDGLTLFESMAIGTAGFTAAQAIQRMEDNGQCPDLGPVVVTGSTGGVGSFAIDMLDRLGYQAVALTRKAERSDYLKALGASEILLKGSLDMGTTPLESARWGGAIDAIGGATLAWLIRTLKPNGNIASIGLAEGIDVHTTVMPFILRGVNLLGINSVYCSRDLKVGIWQRIANDLRTRHLDRIVSRTVGLADLPSAFDELLEGRVTGRIVVDIGM